MVGRLNHLPKAFVTSRATELLDQFQLADAADRPLKTYSGGMRRRLDLAAALMARPSVLFLDEPTTGLDPQSRNDLWEVIEGLVGGGTTVLLTTQYLEEADRLASQLAVIDHGQVIAGGTPAQLKAQLGATVLEVGLASLDDAARTSAVLASVGSHAPVANGTVVEVTVDQGPQAAMEALRSLDSQGVDPGVVHPARAQPRRRVPGPHRPEDRGRRAGRRRRRRRRRRGPGGTARRQGHQRRSTMTTAITCPASRAPPGHGPPGRVAWAVRDALTITKRNLIAYTRVPEALFFSTVQPVMFVLLFTYVFGGAIPIPGDIPYVDYLMPGIFVQTVAFGSVSTSIGLAEDLQKGIIERFRALPMARSAVLAGRTTADLVRNVLVMVIISIVGLLVGFRPSTGVAAYLAGVGIILLFAYALSWGFAVVGLSAPNSETAQIMSFPILFPLTFASSAFVPVAPCPAGSKGSPPTSRSASP